MVKLYLFAQCHTLFYNILPNFTIYISAIYFYTQLHSFYIWNLCPILTCLYSSVVAFVYCKQFTSATLLLLNFISIPAYILNLKIPFDLLHPLSTCPSLPSQHSTDGKHPGTERINIPAYCSCCFSSPPLQTALGYLPKVSHLYAMVVFV